MTADVRRVSAILANADAREAYARVVLGAAPDDGLSAARAARVTAGLVSSGLIEQTADGFVATDAAFRELLAQQPVTPPATGVERYLIEGRIDRYPSNHADRVHLLEWIVERAIEPGEQLDEKAINERLLPFTDDFAVLRRYLVDFELIERTPDGALYRRTSVGLTTRHPREEDHPAILQAILDWWDTPNRATIGGMVPRLFLQFFTETSWVVVGESGEIAAFLIGFRSQDDPDVSYIHFVGVDPSLRGSGIARGLYERFFAEMKQRGCTEVRCVTGPFNLRSQAFHKAMGFETHGDTEIDGVLAFEDYDGPGEPRVSFSRAL